MKNIPLMLLLLCLCQPLLAQTDYTYEIPGRVISTYGIKEIAIWKYGQKKSKPDSSLYKVYQFDKKGRLVLYRGGSLSDTYFQWVQYTYDSSGQLTFKYNIDKDGYISEVQEYRYEKGRLTETRTYAVQYHEIHLKEFEQVRNKQYGAERKEFNPNGFLISSSYCTIFPFEYDSAAEQTDAITGNTSVKIIPKQKPFQKPATCSWKIHNTLDKSGNIIRERTDPLSGIFIDDSFAYDNHNRIIYKKTFNSGDVTKTNSRQKVTGEHRETRYVNVYNKNGQLAETKTYFNKTSACYLSTQYRYNDKGTLIKQQQYMIYPTGCSCEALITADEIYDLSYQQKKTMIAGKVTADTLYIFDYNEFGEEMNNSTYYGSMQYDRQGTLFYNRYKQTNSAGVITYSHIFYGRSYAYDTFPRGEKNLFETFYTHYENGLIKDVTNDGGKQYHYTYTYHSN